ncbi:MAG: peptide chain release factor N(5)-glutamine methyltransferase, partial [Muribaculaceae bacterium]|nr:peptide chain release factor N(5)-glutamine methyltransferase [Muribaculaceae bacterium]
VKADMYEWKPASESLDIVVSNPPYIHPDEATDMEVRVKDFEPHEALFVSADDPIRPYRRIEEIARLGLKPGGLVYMELNPRYAEEVASYYTANGWEEVEIMVDSYGKKRFLKAMKPL